MLSTTKSISILTAIIVSLLNEFSNFSSQYTIFSSIEFFSCNQTALCRPKNRRQNRTLWIWRRRRRDQHRGRQLAWYCCLALWWGRHCGWGCRGSLIHGSDWFLGWGGGCDPRCSELEQNSSENSEQLCSQSDFLCQCLRMCLPPPLLWIRCLLTLLWLPL